jgi:hypothetical protein
LLGFPPLPTRGSRNLIRAIRPSQRLIPPLSTLTYKGLQHTTSTILIKPANKNTTMEDIRYCSVGLLFPLPQENTRKRERIPKKLQQSARPPARSPHGAHALTNWTTLVTPTSPLSLSPPHARLCVSAVGGAGRTRQLHKFRLEGRCAVVLWGVGVERL